VAQHWVSWEQNSVSLKHQCADPIWEEKLHWLGNSEKGSRISEFDWSTTPLGPLENWPSGVKREWAQSLRADKVAPEQLQTSGERSLNQAVELRAVIESLNDAIYIGGLNGITLANQVALDQLGYRSTEELNRNIGALAQEIDTRDANTGSRLPSSGSHSPELLVVRRWCRRSRYVTSEPEKNGYFAAPLLLW
jgi:PAS domain-containing protein